MKKIDTLTNKTRHIYEHLSGEIEQEISSWEPINDYESKEQFLENFFEIFSMTIEHESLTVRKTGGKYDW